MAFRGIIVLLFLQAHCWAQSLGEAQQLLEERIPWAENEAPSEVLLDIWLQRLTHPLSINAATYQDLDELQLLSPQQIQSLIEHRSKNGDLVSLFELQAIPNWDLSIIQKILPLITIPTKEFPDASFWQRILKDPNRYLLWRVDRQFPSSPLFDDTTTAGYLGGPYRHLIRARVSHTRDFSLGLSLEKDAGETWWQGEGRWKKPAFVSAHILRYGKGIIKRWIIGDYQLQWGQGLATTAGFSPGKSGEVIFSTRKPNVGIIPYTSSVEDGFFRGGAMSLQKGPWAVQLMTSVRNRDARLRMSDSIVYVSSFSATGLHRSPRELALRNQNREVTLGGQVGYQSPNNQLSVSLYSLNHSWQYAWVSNQRLDNTHIFRGRHLSLIGIHGQFRWYNLVVFGEYAISDWRQGAGIIGAQLHLNKKWEMAWVARHYMPGFTTIYGDAFGENSQPRNEQGMYWSTRYRVNRSLSIQGYYDRFSFPWLRFQISAPSQGYEALLRLDWKIKRHLVFSTQVRREVKARSIGNPESTLAEGMKDNGLIQLTYRPKKSIGSRIRIQASQYTVNGEYSYGIALMQDLFWEEGVWKASARLALFDTQGFANRQYVYENHLLYAFSLPAYQGLGGRTYINLRVKPLRGITLEARWARTLTKPNNLTDPWEPPQESVSIQVRYQW